MSKQTDLINVTDAITVDGSNNVGIGTDNPTANLDLRLAASAVLNIQGGDGNSKNITFTKNTGDTIEGKIKVYADIMSFETAGSEAMRIDASGNVGIGTAPSTDWRTAFNTTALQVGQSGSLFNLDVSNSDRRYFMTSNALVNSSGDFQHILEGPATVYGQQGGTHRWYTAPSASSGATAAVSERMQIDAVGRVTMPYQPAFLAHGNNAGYIPVSTVGSGSYIPFANAVTNIGNHYNSSTYKFTAPVAGMYHFYSAVYTRTGPATEDIYTRWVVNNSSNKGYAYFFNVTGSEIHNTLTDSIDIYLNANDYIGVTINGAGGADMYTGFQECRFSGYLIG